MSDAGKEKVSAIKLYLDPFLLLLTVNIGPSPTLLLFYSVSMSYYPFVSHSSSRSSSSSFSSFSFFLSFFLFFFLSLFRFLSQIHYSRVLADADCQDALACQGLAPHVLAVKRIDRDLDAKGKAFIVHLLP